MIDIKTLDFNKNNCEEIKNLKFGEKWPVVYLINNNKEMYIGETTNVYIRTNQHLANEIRNNLNKIHIISDEKFNKSAILDIESSLIKFISGEGLYKLQNCNHGVQFHNYYQKEMYEDKFKQIWIELRKKGLVKKDLKEIENSDLFKYSPYKSLTTDQYMTVNNILSDLLNDIKNNKKSTIVVNGIAGTGKTVLGIYIIKLLSDKQNDKLITDDIEVEGYLNEIGKFFNNLKDFKIGLVIPMTSLRNSLKKIFREVKGLNSKMVLSPIEASKQNFDLLIVDEAHRLRRNVNLAPGHNLAFKKNNKRLCLDVDSTELDWIKKVSKHQILFYDFNQTIKPSDVKEQAFSDLMLIDSYHEHKLTSQMRCNAGNEYTNYIHDLLNANSDLKKQKFEDYDFKLYSNINEMVEKVRTKNEEFGLSRVVSGYSWKWKTKKGNFDFDIEIDGYKYVWNTTATDWVNSKNSINEIGCIHTIQGYDLNYCGIIFGNEIKYDKENKKIYIDKKEYKDITGKKSIDNDEELLKFIKNIYVTMMLRGIKGTYIYVCDKNLRNYLSKYIDLA